MLDHVLDHLLDYILDHLLDHMIIGLVTTTLQIQHTFLNIT